MRHELLLFLCAGILSSSLCGCRGDKVMHVERDDWAPDVKAALNDFMDRYAHTPDAYVVFDFDNTTSIFDVQQQLIAYQLETMSFAMDPEVFNATLNHNLEATTVSYDGWISDVSAAYGELWKDYGPFTPEGVSESVEAAIKHDAQWMEFSSKLSELYSVLSDKEKKSTAYSWLLQWFSGMGSQEIHDLAYRSHKKYGAVETTDVTWSGPAMLQSETGPVTHNWISGIQVTENMKELWRALDANGIDVWVCSASGLQEITAAIDAFGLREWCTGVVGMTMKETPDGVRLPDYDYEDGVAMFPSEDGGWTEGNLSTKAMTAGPGKVTAIENAIAPLYDGHGPLAGFMDATGDFNFCTEFSSLRLVVCFNRATRKVTEGGGLIAETAIYERDVLGYDFAKAEAAGDIMYVLQGRDENGMRTFRPSNATVRLGASGERLFAGEENMKELEYFKENGMSVKEILETFSLRTSAAAPHNPFGFEYGFLENYAGYRSR